MIVPMKKAQIVVLKDDKERLLKSLQRYGVIMLIPNSEENVNLGATEEDALLQRTENSLKIISKFCEKTGFVKKEKIMDYEEFISVNPRRKELLDLIENNQQTIESLKSDNQTLQEEINTYLPWIDLDIKLSDLKTPKYARFHTGYIETKNLNEIKAIIDEFGGYLNVLGKASEGQAIIFACYLDDEVELLERIKNLGFIDYTFASDDIYVSEIIEEKQEAINLNLQKIAEITNHLNELALEVDEIEHLNDQLKTESALKKAPVQHTLAAVYLEGWVRSDEVDTLQKAIDEATDIYDLEVVDPTEEETPPTVTKNNKFVSAFEAITNMFSPPRHDEVDPNPAMSIWFWIIFGMMMGDAGYGVVMAIFFFALIKLKKPKGESYKLFKLLFYSSFTTIIWGVLFGSYFGFTYHPILLEPTVDIVKYLILTLIVGGLHVISGILVKAYANIKEGKLLDALFDQFSWILLLVGLGLLFVPTTKDIGMIMALIGAAIILLTAGRNSKNIFLKLFGGIYSLYNTTGYVSDILSYTRILALSLSSAIIGMVMNLLAGMLQGNIVGIFFSIFVYLIGHIFNIAMGLLSAYVHDSRLQYIEFFNKFYEGGGENFEPLSLKLKYIDKVEDQVEI